MMPLFCLILAAGAAAGGVYNSYTGDITRAAALFTICNVWIAALFIMDTIKGNK
jgi:hypothetical protein